MLTESGSGSEFTKTAGSTRRRRTMRWRSMLAPKPGRTGSLMTAKTRLPHCAVLNETDPQLLVHPRRKSDESAAAQTDQVTHELRPDMASGRRAIRYLESKGKLEKGQPMASDSSPRTTRLYERSGHARRGRGNCALNASSIRVTFHDAEMDRTMPRPTPKNVRKADGKKETHPFPRATCFHQSKAESVP